MRIAHDHGKRAEGEGDGIFVLTDKHGGSCSFPPGAPLSKYNGLIHAQHDRFWKTVERLVLPEEPEELILSPGFAERIYPSGARERFHLSQRALHYSIEQYTGDLVLDVDIRPLDDEGDDGRNYEIRHEGDELVVEYVRGEQRCTLVAKGVTRFSAIGEWQERNYPYDERRSDSSQRWIYRVGRLGCDGKLNLTFARHEETETAREEAAHAFTHGTLILRHAKSYATRAYKDSRLSRSVAKSALDALVTRLPGQQYVGILAGLPWFTQFWSRDELVSVGGLIAAGEYTIAKEILCRYLERLDGPILPAHYPHGGLGSADAIGWLAKRIGDLIAALEERGLLHKTFTRLELCYLHDLLGHTLLEVAHSRSKEGLIINGPGETWMDAPVSGDTRAGACIEIQALQLAGYATCKQLARITERGASKWERLERQLRNRVCGRFLKDGKIADMLNARGLDLTERPNIFLALYLYPDLLSKEEWFHVIDGTLPHLWLSWGGLSSISTNSPLFVGAYDGALNTSYHRGDSWFWVNALAALCLKRLDKSRYAEQITKLTEGCVRDLLWHGAAGHCSEVSSARTQEWGGCWAQAWSAALLYELLSE